MLPRSLVFRRLAIRIPTPRWNSTVAAEPPSAAGALPTVADSTLLKRTREAALRTAGVQFLESDEEGLGVAGRETRKMNMYQAVRDAMR